MVECQSGVISSNRLENLFVNLSKRDGTASAINKRKQFLRFVCWREPSTAEMLINPRTSTAVSHFLLRTFQFESRPGMFKQILDVRNNRRQVGAIWKTAKIQTEASREFN